MLTKRSRVGGVVLAAFLGMAVCASAVQALEAPALLNGALYAVIPGVTDGTSGTVSSFIRFFNGATATSTFSVIVVGAQSGKAYGQPVTLQIPRNASVQYTFPQILMRAGSAASAAAANGDSSYSLYLQNTNAAAGYQHVTYDSHALMFEDASYCGNGLLNTVTLANNSNLVVTNVHTSALGNGFPSTLAFHNTANVAVTVKVAVIDAGALQADGSTISPDAGAVTGQTNLDIPANSTITRTMAALQADVNWQPGAGQMHANLIISDPAGGVPMVGVTHTVRNAALDGNINMNAACVVNKPSSANAIYKGTIAGAGGQSGTIAVALTTTVSTAAAKIASAAATSTLEKPQAFEKAKAVSTATGTILLAGNAVPLTGTYDASANTVSLSGGGFAFTGALTSGVYSGTYTAPNSIAGAFSSLSTSQGAVTAYCGTYSEDRHPTGAPAETAGGVFNLQVAANGAVSGATSPTSGGGGPGTFTGQANGATVNVHHSANNKTGNDDDIVAAVVNGVISGSYPVEGGLGGFSGGVCALPAT